MSQLNSLHKKQEQGTASRSGNHEGSLGAEGTNQDQRNQRAPLSGFPLNADRRRALHSCSLASRPGAAACPQPRLPEPDPAETEAILARIQGPCRPETDATLHKVLLCTPPELCAQGLPHLEKAQNYKMLRACQQGHPERSKDRDGGAYRLGCTGGAAPPGECGASKLDGTPTQGSPTRSE